MRARLKPSAIISKTQKKAVEHVLKETLDKQQKSVMRRFFKLMCVSLNDDFGFGAERLMRLMNRISKLAEEHGTDEVFWEHVDKRLDQMGVPFSPEDYKEMEGAV